MRRELLPLEKKLQERLAAFDQLRLVDEYDWPGVDALPHYPKSVVWETVEGFEREGISVTYMEVSTIFIRVMHSLGKLEKNGKKPWVHSPHNQ